MRLITVVGATERFLSFAVHRKPGRTSANAIRRQLDAPCCRRRHGFAPGACDGMHVEASGHPTHNPSSRPQQQIFLKQCRAPYAATAARHENVSMICVQEAAEK
eukprot:4574161-Amphidinium_carterae.1